MLIDSSALVSIILDEEDASKLAHTIEKADVVYVTPIVVYESTMAVARSRIMSVEQASEIVQRFCNALNAQTAIITGEMAVEALSAVSRFGKGRHQASLNMGDCFSYAVAKALNVPLLSKGNDFGDTDIAQITMNQ
jgi:ribonuclease VapC